MPEELQGLGPLKQERSLADAIFKMGSSFVELINFNSLQSHLWHPHLRFLTRSEIKRVSKMTAPSTAARELMQLVFERMKDARKLRQFVACLMIEQTHLGHGELVKQLECTVPQYELTRIARMVRNITGRAVKPVPYTFLSGYLTSEQFRNLDSTLWKCYHDGQFDKLREIADAELSCVDNASNHDLQIYCCLFKATACVQGSSSERAFGGALLDLGKAYDMCEESDNRMVLEGRVKQRLAQVYLYHGLKRQAKEYLEQAEQSIVLVGVPFDRSKFYLRRAKVLAVQQPNARHEIEQLYGLAMSTLDPDDTDSYAVCMPSVGLAKAAFHLNIAFSSNPIEPLPEVSDDELMKAKEVAVELYKLPLEYSAMPRRRCEYRLVLGEIYRLEGNIDLAMETLGDAVTMSKNMEYTTVCSHATARLNCFTQSSELQP